MNKNLHGLLLTVAFLIISGSALFIGWSYYIQTKDIPEQLTAEQVNEIKYDAGALFSTENPGYARGLQYLSAGNYDEAVAQLKTLQPQYAKGTTERNIIDYAIGIFYAFSPKHQTEAMDAFVAIVTDPSSYNGTTRALAIEAIGRTYAATHDNALLAHVFTNPYFKGYLTVANGDYLLAMYELALEGDRISKTPITSARLAEKIATDLYANKYETDAEKEELIKRFDEYLSAGKREIEKMIDVPGYNGYRSEFLSIYGGAIQYMILAQAGQYSRAQVESAYQEAYSLASDNVRPYIILRYASFLAIISSNEKEKIEELSGRLEALPTTARSAFDAFLINIVGQPQKERGNAYELVAVYRSKSPTFDAYVKRALAR